MQLSFIRSILTLYLLSAPLFAQEIVLQTSAQKNTLVELYTSEGCSSCPPAEEFLNSLKNNTELWQQVIPMAFHVDYWDYIGWKDRYAKPAYGTRQRQYAQLQRRSTVYTPAFFVNAKSWRPSFFSKKLPKQNKKQTGVLKIILNKNALNASFQPSDKKKHVYYLNIALLGNGITTKIKAGENKGLQSPHEFVVLDHQQYSSNQRTNKDLQWNINWSPLNKKIKSLSVPAYAIAAWISIGNNPTSLQATGGYLPQDYFK